MRRALALVLSAAVLVSCTDAEEPVPEPPTDAPTGTATPDEPEEPGGPDQAAEPTPADPDADEEATPAEVELTTTDVATGLEAPWAVAWLGDRAFVTERDSGRLLEVAGDGSVSEVRRFDVDPTGEGGLLGLAAHPDGAQLFAYLTTGVDNRVVRFDPDDDADPVVVLDGIPAAGTHNGGRIAVGPDDTLYVATGDAQDQPAAQDVGSLAGKVLRVTLDGDVPPDAPDGSPVWSLGHRNVQGLAFDGDGRLFASEFGPDRDDEVNVIEPGANYGWPEVTGEAGVDGFVDPVLVRQPGDASWSGGVVLADGAIPQWEGDLLVAALRGERLYRIPLEDGTVTGRPEELLAGEYGRLRAAAQAPDGSVWLLTSNRDGRGSPREGDDRIVRIGPAA